MTQLKAALTALILALLTLLVKQTGLDIDPDTLNVIAGSLGAIGAALLVRVGWVKLKSLDDGM